MLVRLGANVRRDAERFRRCRRLNAEASKVFQACEVRATMAFGVWPGARQANQLEASLARHAGCRMDSIGSTPEEADAYLHAEMAKRTRVVKEAGIRTDYRLIFLPEIR